MPVGSYIFQALSIAVMVLYCRVIYLYRGQVAMCLENSVRLTPKEAIANKQAYDRMVGWALTIGAVAVGMAAVKAMTGLGIGSWLGSMSLVSGLAVSLGCTLMVVLQIGVLKAAGGLTLTGGFVEKIVVAKKSQLAGAVIIMVPAILAYSGINPVRDQITGYMVMAEAVVMAVMFAAQTMILFMKQKVSLLVWFLYLCAVEVFPLSFALVSVVKNV